MGQRAEAVVVWAKPARVHEGAEQGESFWWQDVLEHRFGKERWRMALDVEIPGGTHRVEGEFKAPNKLFKVRHVHRGAPSFPPGLSLPVTIDDRQRGGVTVDWREFERRGGVDQLYPADPTVHAWYLYGGQPVTLSRGWRRTP